MSVSVDGGPVNDTSWAELLVGLISGCPSLCDALTTQHLPPGGPEAGLASAVKMAIASGSATQWDKFERELLAAVDLDIQDPLDTDELLNVILDVMSPQAPVAVTLKTTFNCGSHTSSQTTTQQFITVNSDAIDVTKSLDSLRRLRPAPVPCTICSNATTSTASIVNTPSFIHVHKQRLCDDEGQLLADRSPCQLNSELELLVGGIPATYRLCSSRHVCVGTTSSCTAGSPHWWSLQYGTEGKTRNAAEPHIDAAESWVSALYERVQDSPTPSTKRLSTSLSTQPSPPAGEGAYACVHCGEFYAFQYLSRHMARCLKNPNPDYSSSGWQECPLASCRITFKNIWTLNEHLEGHASNGARLYRCRLGCTNKWWHGSGERGAHHESYHGIKWRDACALAGVTAHELFDGHLVAENGPSGVTVRVPPVPIVWATTAGNLTSPTSGPSSAAKSPDSIPSSSEIKAERSEQARVPQDVTDLIKDGRHCSLRVPTLGKPLKNCFSCAKPLRLPTIFGLLAHYRQTHSNHFRLFGQDTLDWSTAEHGSAERRQIPGNKCAKCPRIFTSIADMQEHRKDHNHNAADTWRCHNGGCQKVLKSKAALWEHMVGHDESKELQTKKGKAIVCAWDWCGYVAPEKGKMARHVESAHGWVYIQEALPLESRDPLKIGKMISEVSPTSDGEPKQYRFSAPPGQTGSSYYPCVVCAHICTSRDALRDHLLGHLGANNMWRCSHCARSYASKGRLKEHHEELHTECNSFGDSSTCSSLPAVIDYKRLPLNEIIIWRPTPPKAPPKKKVKISKDESAPSPEIDTGVPEEGEQVNSHNEPSTSEGSSNKRRRG